MNLKTISLGDILPNPFRDIETYPFDEEKIARLIESIHSTGFWPSVIVRKGKEGYQCAFGHHRLEAGRRAGIKEATFVVQPLSDDEMLKMMVDENAIEYGHDFNATLNSVSAVVKAYGMGVIELEVMDWSKGGVKHLRDAPSFVTVGQRDLSKPYTGDTVARYLGWTSGDNNATDRVLVALNALELIEKKVCKSSQFQGAGFKVSQAIVRDGLINLKLQEKVEAAAEEKRSQKEIIKFVAKHVDSKVKALKSGDLTSKQLGEETKATRKVLSFAPKETKKGRDISKMVASLTERIQKMDHTLNENKQSMTAVMKMIEDPSNSCIPKDLGGLVRAFLTLRGSAGDWVMSTQKAIGRRKNG